MFIWGRGRCLVRLLIFWLGGAPARGPCSVFLFWMAWCYFLLGMCCVSLVGVVWGVLGLFFVWAGFSKQFKFGHGCLCLVCKFLSKVRVFFNTWAYV